MERTLKELQDIIYGCWYEPEQVKPEEQSAIPKALERIKKKETCDDCGIVSDTVQEAYGKQLCDVCAIKRGMVT